MENLNVRSLRDVAGFFDKPKLQRAVEVLIAQAAVG
jgi:hypothetical protein